MEEEKEEERLLRPAARQPGPPPRPPSARWIESLSRQAVVTLGRRRRRGNVVRGASGQLEGSGPGRGRVRDQARWLLRRETV